MLLHFQARPWDLYAAFCYAIVVASLLLASGIGTMFALLLVLFLPGYVLVAAFFPANEKLDWIERIALSVVLSIAVVSLLGILLNFTVWGIRFAPIVATITLFTVAVGCAAYWRRIRLPPNLRLSASLDLSVPAWKQRSSLDKTLTIALASSVVVATGSLAYFVMGPRPSENFTEFYILGPTGKVSGFPTALNTSQPGFVIMGITNHEATSVSYTDRVDLVAVNVTYNATSGFNETVEVNRTTLSMFNLTLVNGRNWTKPYTFWINYTGLWKVQFLLFKDGDFSSPYRELHLNIRVT